MKKAFRIILAIVAVLVILLVIAVIAAFQPSVQTWAARKAVADMPGMKIDIGRVDAGLKKIEVSNIRVEQTGLALDLPSATVEMSLLGLLSEKVEIKNLVAKGWIVDLSTSGTVPAAEPAAPPQKDTPAATNGKGIFSQLRLPVDLSLDQADIEGQVLLPPEVPEAAPTRVAVKISGGQLGQGRDGKFDLNAQIEMPDANASVSKLTLQSVLAVRMDTPRSISSISLEADASAEGKQLPQGARLHATISGANNVNGEDYIVALKTLNSPATEKTLISVKASNPSGPADLNGTWAIDLHDADVAPFVVGLGLKLPTFTATGQGKVTADDSFSKIHGSGRLTALVDNLAVLQPELAALGRINLATDFDVESIGDSIRVSTLSADISSDVPVANIKTLQLIEFNTATGALKVPDAAADLIRIDIHGVPLSWAQPVLKDAGFAVSGDSVRGQLIGKARDGGFSIRTTTPVTLRSLSVAQGTDALAHNVDLSADITAEYNPSGINLTANSVTVSSQGTTLLSLSGKAAQPAATASDANPALSATGKLQANLAALLGQPAAADFRVLSRGTADVDLTAKVASDLQQVSAKVAVTQLQSTDKKDLPNITTDLRVDLHKDNSIDLQAPVVIELKSRKSDLNLTANLKPEGTNNNINAVLESNEVYLEDVLTLTALAPNTPASTAATPVGPAPTPSGSENKAPWDGITGQVKLNMKKVVYSQDVQVNDVTGSLKITPQLLSLETLHAAMTDGGTVDANATVKFDPASTTNVYDTQVKLNANDFDPGPFLRAANPGSKPMVEGKFKINGTVSGNSPSLEKIAETAAADLKLTSTGGVFNGFATSALAANLGKIQKATSSSAFSALGGAVLSALGVNDANAIAEKTRAASAAIGRFIEINFDQMTLDVSLEPGKETKINDFSILSPDMRLSANGSLGNTPGVSLLKQALKLTTQMSVRGDQAKDFEILGMLKAEADSLGYTPLLENFLIEGTPSNIVADPLVSKLTSKLIQK